MKKHVTHQHLSNEDLYKDIEKIKAALAEAADNVKTRAGDIISDSIDDAKIKSDEIHDSIAEYTAQQPIKSLGIALLIGIAIGYIMRK